MSFAMSVPQKRYVDPITATLILDFNPFLSFAYTTLSLLVCFVLHQYFADFARVQKEVLESSIRRQDDT